MPLFLGEDKISRVIMSVESADGGINTNDATLSSGAQMLQGVTAYSKGAKYTGTIATVEGPTPDISVSSDGLIAASVSNPKGYQSESTTKTTTQQLTTKGATTITPSSASQIAVNSGVYTTGKITVSAVPTETKTITANGTYNPTSGKYYSQVTVNVPSSGIDTSDATATADDMAQGVTAYVNGQKITGTIETIKPLESNQYYAIEMNGEIKEFNNKQYFGVGVTLDKSILLRENLNVTMATLATNYGDATASDVLVGKTFTSVAGSKVSGTIPSKNAATIIPSTTDQTIDAGQYLSGAQTIKGDGNLVSDNIISGKSIFGVSGSVVIQKYYTGNSEPSSSLGHDGDIYLKV